MLAGRKLLLADDSITIQKVVDLTFADEGVTVVCVNNGREAIDQLEEVKPDVVLVDVFMPQVNGYEVCEYIKRNDNLKHIPVMLLVGSFEPFDEEEARRVGANDTLTKPFQSIRRLIDRVGELVGNRPPEEQIPTAELPKPEPEPVEQLSTEELEITTADTQPLPESLRHVVENAAASAAMNQAATEAKLEEAKSEQAKLEQAKLEQPTQSNVNEDQKPFMERYEGAGEVLLDLGDYGRTRSAVADDFSLDIDLDEVPEPSPAEPAFSASTFRSRQSFGSGVSKYSKPLNGSSYSSTATVERSPAATDPLATTQEWDRPVTETVESSGVVADVPQATPMSAGSTVQLSQEMIDAIARRAVEQLSERVVQEIAWEVVPQLAELLIKRQLEEKNS